MPRPYIIAWDSSDDAVRAAVNSISALFDGQVDVALEEQVGTWPGMQPGEPVYMIAHSSEFCFDDYSNPAELMRTMNNQTNDVFGRRIAEAGKVVLVTCSAGGQPVDFDQFAARNFAQSFQEYVGRPVEAAVGPVDGETLRVDYVPSAYSAGSEDGWFRWDSGSGGPGPGDPFGE